MARVTVCNSKALSQGVLQSLSWFPALLALGETQLLCREDAHAAMGKGPRGGELEPPTNSHANLQAMRVRILEADRPQSDLQMMTT